VDTGFPGQALKLGTVGDVWIDQRLQPQGGGVREA
jgi:hypothetical protein